MKEGTDVEAKSSSVEYNVIRPRSKALAGRTLNI